MMTSQPAVWLDAAAGIPLDRPFTRLEALDSGVTDRRLLAWVKAGYLCHPLRGVYYAAQLEDNLDLRLACVKLVAPSDAVITDRTAGWLHGAPMILAPGDHLITPPISIFLKPGNRLRSKWSDSGERRLLARDLAARDGVIVTTPLRTACDLGRLLHRDQAFAAMDSMVRLGAFAVEELCQELGRFKGYRGVRQARALAPFVDPRSQSPGESILRLRWHDCVTLPPPTPQLEVPGPGGISYFLDLGVESLRFGAEYFGAEYHGEEVREHDCRRRRYLEREHDFLIEIFVAADIHGRQQNAENRLIDGITRARQRFGSGRGRRRRGST